MSLERESKMESIKSKQRHSLERTRNNNIRLRNDTAIGNI